MNKLTRRIKDKGYSLPEFCKAIGFSLRWYREHEKKDNEQNKLIVNKIDELENNNE